MFVDLAQVSVKIDKMKVDPTLKSELSTDYTDLQRC